MLSLSNTPALAPRHKTQAEEREEKKAEQMEEYGRTLRKHRNKAAGGGPSGGSFQQHLSDVSGEDYAAALISGKIHAL